MTFEEIQLEAFKLTGKELSGIEKSIIADYDLALKSIKKQIQTVYAEILSGYESEKYYAVMTKYERLIKLYENIAAEYKALAKGVNSKLINNSTLAISNVYYRQLYAQDWTQINSVFLALHPDVIKASVYGTPLVWGEIGNNFGKQAAYIPQSGTLLEQIISKNNTKTLADIEIAVRSGLIQGKGYRLVAEDIRDVMGNSVNNSLRISRTEGHRNMASGNYAMSQAAKSKGVKGKRQIISTLDMRTRVQSMDVDKIFENKNGYFIYPGGAEVISPGNSGNPKWDINDRESVIFAVDGFEPTTRRAYNPVTEDTDIISFDDFGKWMKDNNLYYDKSGIMRHKKA